MTPTSGKRDCRHGRLLLPEHNTLDYLSFSYRNPSHPRKLVNHHSNGRIIIRLQQDSESDYAPPLFKKVPRKKSEKNPSRGSQETDAN